MNNSMVSSISSNSEGRLKGSYHDIISAIDEFFYQCTATPTEKVWGLQGELDWKINLIWSHSMRVFWSVYELFNWLSYIVVISLFTAK